MTTKSFLQKTFLLGAIASTAVSAGTTDCSNMGGFRVGIGLGVANGVSTQKVNTVGVTDVSGNIIPQFETGLFAPTAFTVTTAGTVGYADFGVGAQFTAGEFIPGTIPQGAAPTGAGGETILPAVTLNALPSNPGTMSRKSNLGKVGLAGALNLEYWMYVGGSALVGFGVDVHNGTAYMNGAKDSEAGAASLPISTKLKTVWGVTPKLMFGWQLAPRTMLTFSVGASIDKYKTQSSANLFYPQTQTSIYNTIAAAQGIHKLSPETVQVNGGTLDLSKYVSPQKFNKTKVGVQFGLGMRTIVAPNVELMIEGKATFGKAIKLTDNIASSVTGADRALLPSITADTTTGDTTLVTSSFNYKSQAQKFTVQKYELLIGVAYKFGGHDKAAAAA